MRPALPRGASTRTGYGRGHLGIIFEINARFLASVRRRFGADESRVRRMSLIDEHGERRVSMAKLAVVGSHSVNGVAALHSEILKTQLFRDFHELWPDTFSNKTNGITQRRWLLKSNPELARLVTDAMRGSTWTRPRSSTSRSSGSTSTSASS